MSFEDRPFIRCSFCFKEYKINDYMTLVSSWIDPKNHKYGKTCSCTCGMEFHKKWQIATKVDNVIISTVDLEIPHAGVEVTDWFEYNYYYETMFWWSDQKVDTPFGKFDKFGGFQYRYQTKEKAITGHKFVVEHIHEIILHPDRWPQDIIGSFCNAIGAVKASEKLYSQETKHEAK